MEEDIELAIESPDGTIDCRLEPIMDEDTRQLHYSATILYPDMVSGFFRSEIYCHNLVRGANGYTFDVNEDVHPKIQKLEGKLAEAILIA